MLQTPTDPNFRPRFGFLADTDGRSFVERARFVELTEHTTAPERAGAVRQIDTDD